jgi:hypothetical protein
VWVMRSNLGKTRMAALGRDWVAESLATLTASGQARKPPKGPRTA